jgi:hypothetical protein
MRLRTFLKNHPTASLSISETCVNLTGGGEVNIVWITRHVRGYTRRRDAVRALRNAGYTQEGVFWRAVPKHQEVACLHR